MNRTFDSPFLLRQGEPGMSQYKWWIFLPSSQKYAHMVPQRSPVFCTKPFAMVFAAPVHLTPKIANSHQGTSQKL